MNAIVTSMIANLYAEPNGTSELIDELLYGMPVQMLEELDGYWVHVQTTYQYRGYCRKVNIMLDNVKTSAWRVEASHVISQSFADILQQPRIQSSKLMTLVRGSIVRYVADEELDSHWAVIQLATGERGYLRKKWLCEKVTENSLSEQQFRENVVQTALSYLTTPYRWGGKTPFGIDCSGLCSMAYMLNGVLIYRDAKMVEDFPIKEIALEQMQKGDLLYFPGHIALYLGDNLYVHSSLDGNEVTINSLNEQHPLYREDLATTITAVGSYFAD
ncbi:C40 family peptidase [Lysinibacillus sphaericus]|uniref:Dipeptidyl-peptidase 6 n=1 Tax=Lysinibacillus sphaericus OT4b.31 TaxID=1285586 RepID=R7Z9I0_LYSSH|nr:SH3 domain-containing C40 family peptidase [Lysinibacillus sphaericus]EON70820.1 dipeptidyl-peptidase 6 [Lysinibacillus sphaericus OT4b.31]